MTRWLVSAGTPNKSKGERAGFIDTDDDATEEQAREAYLAQRPADWVIHTIHPEV